MIHPSISITWRIAEAEAAHAGFSEIGPAHFWIGICKAVDLEISTLLDAAVPEWKVEEERIAADFTEVREALAGVGISPMKLRRALRAELGRKSDAVKRPLHRSPALREGFRRAKDLAEDDAGDMRLALMVLALLEESTPKLDAAIEKLGLAPEVVLRDLSLCLRQKRPVIPAQGKQVQKAEKKISALQRFGRDLTELASKGNLPPLIGRRKELLNITQILLQSRKNNLILVGEPGVGKTGIVEGFAQLLVEGKLPEALGRPKVIEISLASLVAGTKYRGEFEERLESVVREASSEPRPILFIDEIHLLLGAGATGGSMDAANILKPALARGAIRVIGATTTREFRQTIEKDGALERRFQSVRIEEPSIDEAVEILMALKPRMEEHHGVQLHEAALRAAVEWSVRYLPDFRLPDKAIDLVDQACAAARFQTLTPEKLRASAGIGRDEIARAVAARCGIPVGTLTDDEGARLLQLEETLRKRVKGQDQAISAVAEAVRLARVGLKKVNRPVGVFLFVGPSGTGKTELAKALAEVLFHDEKRLIRFDMSECMEEHSISKLIGSPPGYVGHDEGGQLTDAIRTHPYSVVLLDEIEKAHPRILDLFLQVFDEGTLTDSQGRRCDFRESVIIMTSNLGSKVTTPKPFIGFEAKHEDRGSVESAAGDRHAVEAAEQAIRSHMRPELVNRLSAVVHFGPISQETAREILGKCLGDLNQRLAERGLTVDLDCRAETWILQRGFSEVQGARNLEREVEHLLATPIANGWLNGIFQSGHQLQVTVQDGQLRIEVG